MSTVVPTISGPKRPQDKVLLNKHHQNLKKYLKVLLEKIKTLYQKLMELNLKLEMAPYSLQQ